MYFVKLDKNNIMVFIKYILIFLVWNCIICIFLYGDKKFSVVRWEFIVTISFLMTYKVPPDGVR